MDASKKTYKKLTNANGLIRAFGIISLILCVVSMTLEPLGKLIYNMIFNNKINYLLVDDFEEYAYMTQYSCIFLVMSLALVIAAFSSKSKKNIGQGFSSLMVVVPIVVCVNVVIDMLNYLDVFVNYEGAADNIMFKLVATLLVYVLALVQAFLLVLSGLVLLIKAAGEKPTEIVSVTKKIKPQPQQAYNPQQGGFAQPQSFNNADVGAAGFAMGNNAQTPLAQPNNNAIPASAPIAGGFSSYSAQDTQSTSDTAQTVSQLKICPDCKAELAENTKFCKNCGRPV